MQWLMCSYVCAMADPPSTFFVSVFWQDSISKMYDLGLDPDFVGWTAQHTFLSHKNLWK